MAPIPLAPAPPAPGPAPPGLAQHLSKIRAAAAAIIDQFESYAKDLLEFKATFEQVIRKLDCMQRGFDDMVTRFNGMEKTLDELGGTLKGMGETPDCIEEVSSVTVETLDFMDETFDAIVKKVCALEEKVKAMEKRVDEQIRIGLWTVRLFNHYRSLNELLKWPLVYNPPYPAKKPSTLAELHSMNAEMCTALAAALRLPTPPVPTPPPLEWRRKQIINHLGCVDYDPKSPDIMLHY